VDGAILVVVGVPDANFVMGWVLLLSLVFPMVLELVVAVLVRLEDGTIAMLRSLGQPLILRSRYVPKQHTIDFMRCWYDWHRCCFRWWWCVPSRLEGAPCDPLADDIQSRAGHTNRDNPPIMDISA